MAQTLCIKCGSELKVSSSCNLCQEPLTFACTSCEYITEEKVHTDCRNAEVLAKTAGAKEEEEAATTTTKTTTASRPTSNRNKEEEKVKAELRPAPSYMTTKQEDNKDPNNVNPFVAGTAIWQSLMTYWFNAYGEFLKSAPKMTEYWYNTFWKPWLNWAPKQQQQGQDKVE